MFFGMKCGMFHLNPTNLKLNLKITKTTLKFFNYDSNFYYPLICYYHSYRIWICRILPLLNFSVILVCFIVHFLRF